MTHESAPSIRHFPIAVRGYVHVDVEKSGGRPQTPPSPWVLIFDTETTTDPGQRLRVGCYQVRRLDDPTFLESGLFLDPSALSPDEVKTVFKIAGQRLAVHDPTSFVDNIFFKYTYDFVGRCVGLNLPFGADPLWWRVAD